MRKVERPRMSPVMILLNIFLFSRFSIHSTCSIIDKKRAPGWTNLANIDVSEEDDAHWEESVNTGDEICVQTRRQVKTVITGYYWIFT